MEFNQGNVVNSPKASGTTDKPAGDQGPAQRSRRAFFVKAGILGMGTLLAGNLVAPAARAQAASAAAPSDGDAFYALSTFLTHRPKLEADLAFRVYQQLTDLDADFPRKVVALGKAIEQAHVTDIDAFLALPASSDQTLRATMTAIVSAWYLGYTGTPANLSTQDNARFVTYTGALMFEPTKAETVIPTYSRAGTNFWADPPPGTPPPPRS